MKICENIYMCIYDHVYIYIYMYKHVRMYMGTMGGMCPMGPMGPMGTVGCKGRQLYVKDYEIKWFYHDLYWFQCVFTKHKIRWCAWKSGVVNGFLLFINMYFFCVEYIEVAYYSLKHTTSGKILKIYIWHIWLIVDQ